MAAYWFPKEELIVLIKNDALINQFLLYILGKKLNGVLRIMQQANKNKNEGNPQILVDSQVGPTEVHVGTRRAWLFMLDGDAIDQ